MAERASSVEVLRLATELHGRVLVRPVPPSAQDGEPAGHLVGFHGYGESAADSLAALRLIPGAERWTLAAIQGLHRFYRRRTGEVVASWMTREDRELMIQDNLAWVRRAIRRVRPASDDGPLLLAGFSQGVAMAYRAACDLEPRPEGLVVLAGDVPPELTEEDLRRLPSTLLGRGDEDEGYPESQLAADLARLESSGVPIQVCRFRGGHEWADPFLEACGRFLAGLGSTAPVGPTTP